MPDTNRAADMARQFFAAEHGVNASAVEVLGVAYERIPNPPHTPGEMSIDPVLYRYFVDLRSGTAAERLRVEAGRIYRA
jgi:hypothetical protein